MIKETEGAAGDIASLFNHTVENTKFKICFAGFKIDADGGLYLQQAGGGYSLVQGEWLVNGSSADFWVSRSILSGSLDDDAGAGPLNCNVDREYSITQLDPGTNIAVIAVEISDDVSGSPIIASSTIFMSAQAT